jgi:hypothetical protein
MVTHIGTRAGDLEATEKGRSAQEEPAEIGEMGPAGRDVVQARIV